MYFMLKHFTIETFIFMTGYQYPDIATEISN